MARWHRTLSVAVMVSWYASQSRVARSGPAAAPKGWGCSRSSSLAGVRPSCLPTPASERATKVTLSATSCTASRVDRCVGAFHRVRFENTFELVFEPGHVSGQGHGGLLIFLPAPEYSFTSLEPRIAHQRMRVAQHAGTRIHATCPSIFEALAENAAKGVRSYTAELRVTVSYERTESVMLIAGLMTANICSSSGLGFEASRRPETL